MGVEIAARGPAQQRTSRGAQAHSPRILFAVAAILAGSKDLPRAAEGVLRVVCEGLDWDAATFWQIDRHANVLRPVAGWDHPSRTGRDFRKATEAATFPRGSGLAGGVWDAGQPLSLVQFADEDFARARVARESGLQSVFAFPVATGDETLGVIEFFGEHVRPMNEIAAAEMSAIGALFGQFIRGLQLEEALDHQRELARRVLDSSLDAIVSIDSDGVITGWNRQAEATFGWTAAEATGRLLATMLVPIRHRARHNAAVERLVAGGKPGAVLDRRIRMEAMHRDGHEVTVELTVTALEGRQAFTAFMRDVTSDLAREQTLRETLNLLGALTSDTTDIIFAKDASGAYQFVNAAGARFLGKAPIDLVGHRDIDLFPAPDATAHVLRDAEVQRTEESVTTEHVVTTSDGGQKIYQATVAPYRDDRGKVIGTLGVSRDITEQKMLERELAHRALHDALTSLPNRVLFVDRLQSAVARATRTGATLAVAFIDLDQFKVINDGLGHAAADELLVAVAGRLAKSVRRGDSVARFGGDEFMALWEDASDLNDGAAQRLMDVFTEPFVLGTTEVFVRASIGVAIGRAGREGAEELVRRADAAMYRAKARGRARLEIYDADVDADRRPQMALSSSLARAVEHNQLLLHYQPIIDLGTGSIVSAEALVRWRHPQRGLLPPSAFILLAEEYGHIGALTAWVIKEALKRGAAWLRSGFDAGVAVNLSALSLVDDALVRVVSEALEKSTVPPGLLTLEITESAIMAEPERTASVLTELRRLGVRLAIDDFGTGYSSLAYLQRLPVHELKIDRSFVSGMASDRGREAIVRASVDLAHEFGLDALAEGVEDAATFDMLRGLGCDRVQGFHIARPMPVAGLRKWMTAANEAEPRSRPATNARLCTDSTRRAARHGSPECAGRRARPLGCASWTTGTRSS
jgi:diguanylate cyclase (GGDEF)-like protein/PAS domain S-box-containing protein